MRILHVGVGNLGPGGVTTYLNVVSAGQRNDGNEVDIVEVWPVRSPDPADPIAFASHDELLGHIARTAPDVVHLHSLLPGYSGIGKNSVLTVHDHLPHCPSGGRFLDGPQEACTRDFGFLRCLAGHYFDRCGSRHPTGFVKRFLKSRNAISFPGQWIAPSSDSRSRILKRGIRPDRVHLVRNPSPMPPCGSKSDFPSSEFLFVGRLFPNKGCEVAVRAVAMTDTPRLRILGDGPSKAGIEHLARELGISDRIAFDGWLPRRDVVDLLGSCTALVVPSLWPEPFGLVVLEAFSLGRPVIASRIGGLLDLVDDGRNGALFDPGSAEQLAALLRRFSSARSEDLELMGREGLKDVADRFSLRHHLDELDSVYRSAIR